ncbi:MAG: hypothetical protein CVV42_02760 [Candidatus Riflebacteria bacterium HGW-Riflebacteria-2]|nr:MAG: hypothetical protein CVV42_02760 [Candidatus Riflebacteria bacterium HGW-Riflebacteria-2]
MANCNICNKEIEEGYICSDCARIQRQQSGQTPAPKAPAAGQQAGTGGFSLNSLRGAPTPTPQPRPAAPAGTPARPAAASPLPPPRPMPKPAAPAPVNPPTAPEQPLPSMEDSEISEPLDFSQLDFSGLDKQEPSLPEYPEQPIESPPAIPAPVIQQAPPRPVQPTQPPPQPAVARPAAFPGPITGNTASRRPSLNVEKPTDAPASLSEEQQQIQREVYSSDMTGYGDEELEIAILAGIMKDSFILDSLKGKGLMSGLFSTRFSRAIYQSVLSLREESPDLSSLDRIVLKNKLRQLNLWDASVQLTIEKIVAEPPPELDRALHFLELMKEQALKRKLKEVSHNISDFIEKPADHANENIETFTNKIIQDVRNIQKARTTKRINLVKEEMRDIIGDIENRERVGEIDIIGYSCEPMHYLNTAISGFRKGFMYAIAGAPRRGKTTFTLELATRVATLNKIPVLFFTYEQTKKNLTYRLLAKESRLNPDTLQRKKIRSDMISDAKFMGGWKKMQEYMDHFYIIEATKEDTVDRIRSYAYNAMQDFNTDNIMIFIDYIQKMPLSRNYMDEKFKVEEISTELKGLSIELNNPIMTISSLSKEGCMIDATSDSERPTMYHCKGSGDLEYDLDCAMIQAKDWGDTKELFQQLQHKAEELGKDSTRIPKVDVVNLYLDKNRDAPEGIFSTIQYLFFIEDNKFIELGPKFDDDRFRFSKIEELVDKLIEQNFIIFFDRPRDTSYNKGRVSIKLKNF